MLEHRILAPSLPLLLLVLDGCVAWDVDDHAIVAGSSERAIVAMNGQIPADLGFASQYMDWLRLNALTTNPGAVSSMAQRPLHSSTYNADWLDDAQTSPYLIDQLCDPYARQVMKRVVECALSGSTRVAPAQQVTWFDAESLQSETWQGKLGLCPQWHDGLPSAACLERVSACVLARLNEQGQAISISMRGWQAAGQTLPIGTDELATHTAPDGAFFGTLFDPAQINDISVQVRSCSSAQAKFAYTDTKGQQPVEYVFSLPSPGGSAANATRDAIHDAFLVQSGFSRIVYQQAFACWDPYADPVLASQSGRVCAGLIAGVDCAVTSVGDCSASCSAALDAGDVPFYSQCAGPDLSTWLWPLDVYYSSNAGLPAAAD
jgi:hypothetical protein